MRLGGYHIILVPSDSKKTKRLYLSTITVCLLIVAVLLAIPLVFGSLFSTAHYQNKIEELKVDFSEEHQIVEQKELMTARMAVLEQNLTRVEQSLNKLEGTLDVELGYMETGLGPLSDTGDNMQNRLREIPLPESAFDSVIENEEVPAYRAIHGKVNRLDSQLIGLETKIEELYELNEDKIRFFEATPNIIPADGWITSSFGFRRSPYSGIYRMHYGIDIAAPYGSAIKAPADGKVILSSYKGGYGRKLVLDHGYGVMTVYAHNAVVFVKDGERVKRGDIIATVGSTGSATGPHLHYEVHVDGIPTDPLKYVMK